MQPNPGSPIAEDEEFSLGNQWKKLRASIGYALSKWKILLVSAVIGAGIMAAYAAWRPVTYTARTTFVVEESKLGSGSLMSAMAGQFGFDIGSMGGGTGGVLSGDNVLELLKSHSLIRKTLLTNYGPDTTRNLADVYAEVAGWKEKWQNSSKVGKWVRFKNSTGEFGRTEDSLLQKIIRKISEEDLSISKPDRKLGFFEMTATMKDEKLALYLSQRLLKITSSFYIDTKTRRLSTNVNRLQAKADSLASSLNVKTYNAANANKQLLDANPIYSAPEVTAEISGREKIMQGTIYAEIVKNLEMSKTALMQETPTFQVVDDPEIPLKDNKIPLAAAIVGGAFLFLFLTGVLLIVLRKQPAVIG